MIHLCMNEHILCQKGTNNIQLIRMNNGMPLTGFEPALTIVKHRLGENAPPYGFSPEEIPSASANLLFGASETLTL